MLEEYEDLVMNQQSSLEEDNTSAKDLSDSVNQQEEIGICLGKRLRQFRENLNLTVRNVSEQLCLSPAIINQLEEGHYEKCGSLMFVKGYIRSYARFLKIPEAEIDTLFIQLGWKAEGQMGVKIKEMKINLPDEKKPLIKWVTYLVLFFLITSMLMWCSFHREEINLQNPATITPIISQSKVLTSEGSVVENRIETDTGSIAALPSVSDSINVQSQSSSFSCPAIQVIPQDSQLVQSQVHVLKKNSKSLSASAEAEPSEEQEETESEDLPWLSSES
jgi:cytoskeleton protein RodZ